MGAEPEPVVFLKPPSCLLPGGGTVPWPEGSREVHHEVELVLLLGSGGTFLDLGQADGAIAAVAVGLDLTARDLQATAKAKGQPWARSKGFPGAGPVSEFVGRSALGVAWADIDLRLEVDGAVRQQAHGREMILDPPAVVARLSRWFSLAPGDLIFTGTPAGVGPLAPGSRALATSAALGVSLAVALAAPAGPA
ncbi:MAG: fumarylacetoacetate hydrolase family protein [Acidobacteria bacterium]|nr:fumarylacetoacetate hydrolase family protein [Acidobacteriota bacterium]